MNNQRTYLCTINFRVERRTLLLMMVIMVFALVKFSATYGQASLKVDSLKQVIDSRTGIEKFDPLVALIRITAASNYKQALTIADEAYTLAKEHGDSAKIVKAGRIRGQLFNYLERSNEAIELLEPILLVAFRNNYKEDHQKILENLAIAYTSTARYDKALQFLFEVLPLHEAEKNDAKIGYTLNNIGRVYYRMKNYNEGLKYYGQALERLEISGRRYDIDRIQSNIGLCYIALKQFENAEHYFNLALKECKVSCHDQVFHPAQHGLGITCFEMGKFQESLEHFNIAIEVAKRLNNKRFIAENLFWIGKIHFAQDELAEASEKFFEASKIAERQDLSELLMGTYEQLAGIYDLQGDYENATRYFKKYVALKDTVYNDQLMESIAQVKADYQQRENLAIIKANEMTIAQQRRLTVAVVVIAFLIGGFFLILWRKNGEIKAAKDVIFEQNKRLEIRNRELDVLVEDKTMQLRLANLSLKEMNDELNTFIFKASQEILAPLATLKGICYVAGLDIMDKLSLNYLHKINNTITVLNSAFKRLLIINKLNQSRTNSAEIDLRNVVDNVLSVQRQKGLPQNLVVRKNVAKNAIVNCDQELLSIMLENSIDNAIKSCNNSQEAEHFIDIDVSPKNGRVNVRIVHNGVINKKYKTESLYPMFLEEFSSNDLYFLKTTAGKVGGKVDLKRTPEGYNELSVVL